MPIRIHSSEQTCAAGAAMFAATAAGLYAKVEDAMNAMGQGFEKTYEPQSDKVAYYATRYKMYLELGNKIESK
jgi:L-ribulokinase